MNLIEAISHNRVDIVRLILKNGLVDMHENKEHALCRACMVGNNVIVRIFLKAGADVHAQDDYALRQAVEHRQITVVKTLIKAGADVQARDNYALEKALFQRDMRMSALLIRSGATPVNRPIPLAVVRLLSKEDKLRLKMGGVHCKH